MKQRIKLSRAITICSAVAALALVTAGPVSAQKRGTKVGTLVCKTVPGMAMSLLIHSVKLIRCTFTDSAGRTEKYRGEAGIGLGIDLDWETDEAVTYTVFSTRYKAGTHMLAGRYGGLKAAASAKTGGGAQLLVGGGFKSVSLQPALAKTKGYGIAVGIGYMYLQPDK